MTLMGTSPSVLKARELGINPRSHCGCLSNSATLSGPFDYVRIDNLLWVLKVPLSS